MNFTLLFHIEANKEFISAYQWYEERQIGLGERFIYEAEKQIDNIISNPFLFHFSKGIYREVSIGNFPFTIVYKVNQKKNTIFISSIFHTSRNPRFKYRK